MKNIIITIDTEGDNLWALGINDTITTKNARYVPRFQELCNKYKFKPVYLTNYEMANDDYFVEFARGALKNGTAEIGLHLHAWNNPPYYELKKRTDGKFGLPYLIEYPQNIMREKIKVMTALLREKFNTEIVSHRAGRWAMNQDYFEALIENGIKIDCSVTPHVSWKNAAGYSKNTFGTDYRKCPQEPFVVKHSRLDASIVEVPVTIRKKRWLVSGSAGGTLHHCASMLKNSCLPSAQWLRPDGKNLNVLLKLIDTVAASPSEYLMFMLHSSELMPGGSPVFSTRDSIEVLYKHLDIIFERISKYCAGITLKEFNAGNINTGINRILKCGSKARTYGGGGVFDEILRIA